MLNETVTSEETSTVETPAKKRQMQFSILENGNIQASFGEGIDPIVLDLTTVPENVQLAAITEGLISRARSYTNNLTDEDRTPENLAKRVAKAFSALMAGTWKAERGTVSAEFTIDQEAAHVFRIKRGEKKGEPYTSTQEETAEAWNALSDEQRKTAKSVPLFQLAIAEVKARRDALKLAKLAKAAENDTSDF